MKINMLVALFFLILAGNLSAQKIKEKDGIYYADEVPIMNVMGKDPWILGSIKDETKYFSVHQYTYTKRVTVTKNGSTYTEPRSVPYLHVKFIDSSYELYYDSQLKSFVKDFYTWGCLSSDGSLRMEKVESFIRTYGIDKPDSVELLIGN